MRRKAHVDEWRRVGAKRVLGDVGRGIEGGEVDGVTAGMSPKAASRVGWQEVARHGVWVRRKKGAASPRSDATPWCAA